MVRFKREPEIGLSRLTAYPSSESPNSIFLTARLISVVLVVGFILTGGFTYIAMRAKAHNYDLYSFSAIFSPNILQFIHNSASCNIPLR